VPRHYRDYRAITCHALIGPERGSSIVSIVSIGPHKHKYRASKSECGRRRAARADSVPSFVNVILSFKLSLPDILSQYRGDALPWCAIAEVPPIKFFKNLNLLMSSHPPILHLGVGGFGLEVSVSQTSTSMMV